MDIAPDYGSGDWGFESLRGRNFFPFKKGDNKGVRLIKKFVFKIYKLMKETCSEEDQDE